MNEHDIRIALDGARKRFLSKLEDASNLESYHIESCADDTIAKLPEPIQAILAPKHPDKDLLSQATKLSRSVLPALKEIDAKDPGNDPLWPLEEAYMLLSGVIRLTQSESKTLGECLRSDVSNSDDRVTLDQLADEFHDYLEFRFDANHKTSQNDRLERAGNALISQAVKSIKDHESFSDVKAVGAEFKQYVQSMKTREQEDVPGR